MKSKVVFIPEKVVLPLFPGGTQTEGFKAEATLRIRLRLLGTAAPRRRTAASCQRMSAIGAIMQAARDGRGNRGRGDRGGGRGGAGRGQGRKRKTDNVPGADAANNPKRTQPKLGVLLGARTTTTEKAAPLGGAEPLGDLKAKSTTRPPAAFLADGGAIRPSGQQSFLPPCQQCQRETALEAWDGLWLGG
jgi:hypothetical protein